MSVPALQHTETAAANRGPAATGEGDPFDGGTEVRAVVHGKPSKDCAEKIEKVKKLFLAHEVRPGSFEGRFFLFHGPASMSSEIARAVFDELNVSYSSHHMDITDPYNQNYHPGERVTAHACTHMIE